MARISIRPYEPGHDEAMVYALWQRTLHHTWPLSRAAFHRRTVGSGVYRPGDHLVAQWGNGDLVGFVATQAWIIPGLSDEQQPRGEVMAVLVDSSHQRRGVGRALLDRALTSLSQRGVSQAQLGAGARSYFWPGVPTDLSDAWHFFEACGWPYVEQSFDLVLHLSDFRTPPGIYERIRLPDATVGPATERDVSAILVFEARHFPQWLPAYETVVRGGTPTDIVVAKDMHGDIIGAALAVDHRRAGFVWRELLGDNSGGVAVLGVAEAARGNGLGLALATRVTELLHARGVAISYVGYTWLKEWYGVLGYRVWREYRMSWKALGSVPPNHGIQPPACGRG